MRTQFSGHRRYSITHRAVQRLRELVPSVGEDDDEALRDRLDQALSAAEDAGKAVRTLDVMLAEPQILIPLESFGEVLYAIIKEDTVVTVLPRGHGEEILQRGQALEQRVAAGEQPTRQVDRDDSWERRRWRRDAPPPVIERVVRAGNGDRVDEAPPTSATPAEEPSPAEESPPAESGETRRRFQRIVAPSSPPAAAATERKKPLGTVAEALARGMSLGRRRAATLALGDALSQQPSDAPLQPLWALLGEKGLPEALTVGDLIAAVRSVRQ